MVCGACQKVLSRQADFKYHWDTKPGSAVVHHRDFESLRKAADDEKCIVCHTLWQQLSASDQKLAIEHSVAGGVVVTAEPVSNTPERRKGTVSKLMSSIHRRYRLVIRKLVPGVVRHQDTDLVEQLPSVLIDESVTYARVTASEGSQATITAGKTEQSDWELYVTLEHGFIVRAKITSTTFVFYSLRSKPDHNSRPRFMDLKSKTTAFPDTKPFAVEWLRQCRANHKTCNNDYNRGRWNPTRLLDLKVASQGKVIVIEDTASIEPLVYATLSHRWGQAQFLQLTKTTRAKLKAGVPISALPKTFQQAIEVVAELGLQFLWIDSLCIEQNPDDLADWVREVSLMEKVYQHGLLNISATGSEDISKGLFQDRDNTENAFADVELANESTGALTQHVLFKPYNEYWQENVEKAPLNARGWVLQERILSKRVLHFGKKQLFWECRELRACESYPDGLPEPQPGIKQMDYVASAVTQESDDRVHQEQKFWAYDRWREIVSTYSRCSLTNPADKLPAIMGIAKRMSPILCDTYVAGLWSKFLVSDLAWMGTSKHGSNRYPTTYRAPTWSWASLDIEVFLPSPQDEGLLLTVEEVSLDYATEDKYGLLNGGRLHVKGILRRLEIRKSDRNDEPWQWRLTYPLSPHLNDGDIEQVRLDQHHDNFDNENAGKMLFCIEIRDNGEFLHLLLLRSENISAGRFSRIGIASLHYQMRTKMLGDSTREQGLPCVSCDAETELYTICII